jgi:hypothetical protein
MKFSGIIGLTFLVMFILTNLKLVSAATETCIIQPQNNFERLIFCRGYGTGTATCPTTVDKNGDGNYGQWVRDAYGRLRWDWDLEEGPGVAGCDCAEEKCTNWCTNDACNWGAGVKVCALVCNVPSKMPHCVGAVVCPSADEPCDGSIFGNVSAGGCCWTDAACITYAPGGPPKCIISENSCYGYYNFPDNPVLSPGFSCDYADLGQPCGNDTDCRVGRCVNNKCFSDTTTSTTTTSTTTIRPTTTIHGGGGGGRYFHSIMLNINDLTVIAVVTAVVILIAVFAAFKYFSAKKSK